MGGPEGCGGEAGVDEVGERKKNVLWKGEEGLYLLYATKTGSGVRRRSKGNLKR